MNRLYRKQDLANHGWGKIIMTRGIMTLSRFDLNREICILLKMEKETKVGLKGA